METHLEEWAAECLRRRLSMDHKEIVGSDGRKGGLVLMWKKEVVMSLRHKTEHYIDVYIGWGRIIYGDSQFFTVNLVGQINIYLGNVLES
jgi:hypothetical protein